jgi:hypothetical protein
MKTSKIILLSLAGIIVLFMLSLLIEKKEKNIKQIPANLLSEKQPLPVIRHLRVNDSGMVNVSSGESDSIEILFEKGKKPDYPFYRVDGDTLIIDRLSHTDQIHLFVTLKNLESAKIIRSSLTVKKLTTQRFGVLADSSMVHFTNCSTDTLQLTLNGRTHCTFDNKYLAFVNIESKNSTCRLESETIGELVSNLESHSELSVNKALKYNVKTDSTSVFFSY